MDFPTPLQSFVLILIAYMIGLITGFFIARAGDKYADINKG